MKNQEAALRAKIAQKQVELRSAAKSLKWPSDETHVEVALRWCSLITEFTVRAEGMTISEEADRHWLADYRRKFRHAVEDKTKNVNFFKDGPMLSQKAIELGKRACEIAKEQGSSIIELDHARMASDDVDCKPDKPPAREVWCQPVPEGLELSPIAGEASRLHSSPS